MRFVSTWNPAGIGMQALACFPMTFVSIFASLVIGIEYFQVNSMPDYPILTKKVIGTRPCGAILMTAPFQITQKVIKFAADSSFPMPRLLRQVADGSFPMPRTRAKPDARRSPSSGIAFHNLI